jgi:hypothetical protein
MLFPSAKFLNLHLICTKSPFFDDSKFSKVSGIVEPSPESLRCLGSRWVLRIDQNGVRHESDLKTDS